jgi:hypothetical protein
MPGSPLEVLSLCPQPAIDERDMGPKDIIVDFMLVRDGDSPAALESETACMSDS